MKKIIFRISIICTLLSSGITGYAQTISSWLTTPDRSMLFQQQDDVIEFEAKQKERVAYIVVDPARRYQSMEGFGFALTGGSAEHLNRSPR